MILQSLAMGKECLLISVVMMDLLSGSGDVLAGIIGSFCGQKMELGEATINASFIMSKTAEELAKQRYFPSILPTDIIENLFMPLKNESLSSPEG